MLIFRQLWQRTNSWLSIWQDRYELMCFCHLSVGHFPCCEYFSCPANCITIFQKSFCPPFASLNLFFQWCASALFKALFTLLLDSLYLFQSSGLPDFCAFRSCLYLLFVIFRIPTSIHGRDLARICAFLSFQCRIAVSPCI